MEIIGNTAYVAGCMSGLHVMDLSNPAEPVEVMCRDGAALSVCISGNRAYVTSGFGGVVLDISNPTQPQELGRWRDGMFYGILVDGNVGVVTTEEGSPFVLDVSDPENVHIIGNDPFAGCYMRPVGMAGEYFGLMGSTGTFDGGLRLYDLSNPEQPIQVAAIDTNYSTRDAVIYGGYAYLATNSLGLRIIDLSNPLQPVVVAACDDSVNSPCYAVTVTGNHAVVGKEWGLNIWNVTDHSNPIFEGSLTTNTPAWQLFSTGAFVYIHLYYPSATAATVIDISNPAAPTEVGSFGDMACLCRMTVSGTMTYVADRCAGLRILDTTDPDSLFEVGCSGLVGTAFGCVDVATRENYAYLPDDYRDLLVADMRDPVHPQLSLGWQAGYPANLSRIIVADNYAYVADDCHQRVHTFSLADPSLPVWVDSLRNVPGEWEPVALATLDGFLCIVNWDGFYTLSLANPAAPQLERSLQEAAGSDLAIVGHYAFVAASSVVRIIDLSDPSQPTLAGQITAECRAIAARANILVTADDNGLKAWDITNPPSPQLVGYYTTYAEIENIEKIEDVGIFDGYVLTVSPYRFRAYECDALLDTRERPVPTPQAFALSPCYPNPFNPSTVIRFSLTKTEKAKLTIYDVMGRQVQTLVNDVMTAGQHSLTFDGTGLASGIYFARLESNGFAQTHKLLLIK
ncbi:MAG: T9SS type A sorting domain-containing protein [bacterium]